MNKSKNIEIQDKRLKGVSRLSEDWVSPWTGQRAEKGTIVQVVAVCNYEKLKVAIPMPSAPAMFIHTAKQMYDDSIQILNKIFEDLDFKKKGQFDIRGWDGRMIDYFECMTGSYIFSITAIESFVNEEIPDDYVYTKIRGDKKCTESYSKEQIERFLSLDEKVSSILPSILNVKPPKGKKIYQNYVRVREVRDRIIHMKSKDRKSGEKETIWNELLSRKHTSPVSTAIELIKYFHISKDYPRWLNYA